MAGYVTTCPITSRYLSVFSSTNYADVNN